MTSRERVKAIFNHELPDRIGLFDFFDEITIINWRKQGLLPNDMEPAEYFDFDLDFTGKNSSKNKFVFVSFDGPFQQFVLKKNLQKALIDFVREPRHTKEFFRSALNNIYSDYNKLKEQGRIFDGVWLGEDIAYDSGLYFSVQNYKDMLFDFHSEISSFFKKEKLSVIFHCDGNIEKLLPLLIKVNFQGIHPLQEYSNPNIMRIKKDLKGAITFIGGVGLSHLKGVNQDVLDRVLELKEDGDYIFCFDGPIPQDSEFKAYQDLINSVETIGAYR